MNHPLIDRLAADERAQLLSSLRESDQSPYYRTMQSGIGGTATIRGVDRIMLGSTTTSAWPGTPRSWRPPPRPSVGSGRRAPAVACSTGP